MLAILIPRLHVTDEGPVQPTAIALSCELSTLECVNFVPNGASDFNVEFLMGMSPVLATGSGEFVGVLGMAHYVVHLGVPLIHLGNEVVGKGSSVLGR